MIFNLKCLTVRKLQRIVKHFILALKSSLSKETIAMAICAWYFSLEIKAWHITFCAITCHEILCYVLPFYGKAVNELQCHAISGHTFPRLLTYGKLCMTFHGIAGCIIILLTFNVICAIGMEKIKTYLSISLSNHFRF